MSRPTTLILAALEEELTATVRLLQLTTYESVYVGEVGGATVVAAVTGPGASRAARALESLAGAHRPQRVVSVGFAGGLDPSLAGGDVVAVRWVVDGKGGAYVLDDAMPPRLGGDAADRPVAGTLVTVASPLHAPQDKARALARWRAAMADMETFALAGAAMRLGLPLFSVRAVSDPADVALPEAAMRWVTPEGRTDRAAAGRFAMLHPGWVPTLMTLGRHARRGAEGLARAVAQRLGAVPG